MKASSDVSVIYYTGMGMPQEDFAARLLAFTKNTRLNMNPSGLKKFLEMDEKDLATELQYMANTIPSSWEFVDVIFSINNVSRACAQQITRTRTASFAMQSQRVTDMRSVSWHEPEGMKQRGMYELSLKRSIKDYQNLVDCGESLENARGLLPINVNCNLIAKYNLRTLVDLLRARDSLRVQGEYQGVARQMKAEVLRIWPWAEPFFKPQHEKAIALIEEIARDLPNHHMRMQLAKAADLIKKG